MVAAPEQPHVEYRIDLIERHAHLVTIEARFPVGGGDVDLKLPVWTPGSYLVREFERHLQDVTAISSEGKLLSVRKVDKATWRVDAREAAGLIVRYRVYANDLTVRSSHLDDSHAFLNGATMFLYTDQKTPARITVDAPPGWRVTVGLPEEKPNSFFARDYDELVDSPFEIGTHELLEFNAQGKRHRLAIWGRASVSRTELLADFVKIIDTTAALFGEGLPYDDYTFILMLAPNQYGGLEHARSCALLSSPFTFHPRKKYEEFLELVAHEYFHLWNVKRIHPDALGPFDYQREAYTRSLWVMEGITSYYDRYLLVRAGLQKPEKYLEKLAEEIGKIAGIPGRKRQSLEESSFDAWIKLYRPDENSLNSTISYYLKGGVVALLLDLEMRARSNGKRTLDDFMRLLWQRYGKAGQGFRDEDVQPLAEEASGVSLNDFFDRHVRGRDELDADRILRTVGLQLSAGGDEEEAKEPWLGINTREDGDSLIVASAVDGGPGVESGLYANDELVALDGFRIDNSSLKDRLSAKKPGDIVTFTIFRRDELRTVEVTLAVKPADKFKIAPAVDATDEQKARYEAWLGAPMPTGDEE
ncbi:MAG: peptidase domain protein [Myxococcales bacterium]|nr:peptidase domain protein [Myxococcales bacterium]